MLRRCVLARMGVMLAGILCLGDGNRATAVFIDAINPGAVPVPNTVYSGTIDNGWYYTPSQSYSLEGISTFFQPINNGTGAHTITVQIQTDRPVNGGTVLDQGTFSADSAIGGMVGATFATPVALTAGTSYFVDFLNIEGMGLNLGQFAVAADGSHVPSAGATTRLAAYYKDVAGDTQFTTVVTGNAADGMLATGNASDLEPILFFSGTAIPSAVPEPAGVILLGTGLLGVAFARRRLPASRS